MSTTSRSGEIGDHILISRQGRLLLKIVHNRSHARDSLLVYSIGVLLHSVGFGLGFRQSVGALETRFS